MSSFFPYLNEDKAIKVVLCPTSRQKCSEKAICNISQLKKGVGQMAHLLIWLKTTLNNNSCPLSNKS